MCIIGYLFYSQYTSAWPQQHCLINGWWQVDCCHSSVWPYQVTWPCFTCSSFLYPGFWECNNTLRWLHRGNRTYVVTDSICNSHTLLREDSPFVEFACCIKNYPKQEHFEWEVVDTRAINMYWQQGAGINLAVCRYLTQHLVMMEFQHFWAIGLILVIMSRMSWNVLVLWLISYHCLMVVNSVLLRYFGNIIAPFWQWTKEKSCIIKWKSQNHWKRRYRRKWWRRMKLPMIQKICCF